MQRTYLPWFCLGGLLPITLGLLAPEAVKGGALFESRNLDASRFAILAKPVGRSDWSLVVLEQLRPSPACWENRADGLVDAALTRFDFTGICSRYIDSNGYSLRIGEVDLASRYRLKLRQVGRELQLLASNADDSRDLLVGRGTIARRDRDGFVALNLEPEWQLRRRAYGAQTLSHVYFANSSSLGQLLSRAGGTAPAATTISRSISGSNRGLGSGLGSGPIALEVVPFRQ